MLNEAGERTIVVHWWNNGKKTLDFRGKCKDYLKERGFKAVLKGDRLSIRVSTSSSNVVLTQRVHNAFGAFDAMSEAVRIFLTMMGDKATLETNCRKYLLNWR